VSDAEPPDQITYDLPGALELLATLVASSPASLAVVRVRDRHLIST
jgi:hypothetical protein